MVTFICCSGGGQEGAGDLSDGWRAIVLRLSSPEESCQLPTFTLRSHSVHTPFTHPAPRQGYYLFRTKPSLLNPFPPSGCCPRLLVPRTALVHRPDCRTPLPVPCPPPPFRVLSPSSRTAYCYGLPTRPPEPSSNPASPPSCPSLTWCTMSTLSVAPGEGGECEEVWMHRSG